MYKVNEIIKERFVNILGAKYVLFEQPDIAPYETSTTSISKVIPLVIQPDTNKALAQCVAVANEFDMKIYPISCGNNHGYNSASSISNDCIIFDLHRMNKIISYDPYFDILELEPGVTFKQLFEFLAKNGNEHMVSGYGGSAHSSIMGNALDRGVGKGYYGNRELSSEVSEVVLADGTILNLTDRLNLPDATAKFPSSVVGIDIKKLFLQSNLAVVSKMTIQLERIPQVLCNVSFSVESDEKLPELISKLHELNNKKLFAPVYSLYNDERLVVGCGLYQKKDFPEQSMETITNKVINELSKRYNRKLSRWNCSLAIHCSTQAEANSKKIAIKEILGDTIDSYYFSFIEQDEAKKAILSALTVNESEILESSYKYLFNLGYTNEYDQQTLYWRLSTDIPVEKDPIKDDCGLIFFAPKVPFHPDDILRSFMILKETSKQYQYELPVTFQFKSKQIAYIVLPILFDRKNEESVKKAIAYHQALTDKFLKHHYLPYRLNNLNMDMYFDEENIYHSIIRKIKNTLDPKFLIDAEKYMSKKPYDKYS